MSLARVSLLSLALIVALVAGCDPAQKNQKIETGPVVTERTPPPQYPEATVPPPEPQPATTNPPANNNVAAGDPDPDVYQPPVDSTTPIPPPDRAAAAPRPRPRPAAPRESYAPARPKTGQTYVVKKGDTLQEISKKYYGTTKRWRRIYEANRGALKDPNKLSVGTKLTIPPK